MKAQGFEKGEVIEGIRVNGGQFVGIQIKIGQTAESIEHTRREGGQFVGIQV